MYDINIWERQVFIIKLNKKFHAKLSGDPKSLYNIWKRVLMSRQNMCHLKLNINILCIKVHLYRKKVIKTPKQAYS
jgi:hypothetical protein